MANVEKFVLNSDKSNYNVYDSDARKGVDSLKSSKMDSFTVQQPLLLANSQLSIDLSNITTEIEDIKNKNTVQIPDIKKKLETVENSINNNKSSLNNITQKANTNEINISNLTAQQETFETNLTQLEAKTTANTNDISNNTQSISDLNNSTNLNKTNIQANSTNISKLTDRVSSEEIKTTANINAITELQTKTNTNTTDISSLKERVLNTETDIINLQDDDYLKKSEVQNNVIDSNYPPSNTAVINFVKANINDVCPVGTVLLFASKTIPVGNWLICDGRSLKTQNYQNLYNIIGNTYGGNETDFNLPNLTSPNENMVYIIKN